MNNLAERRKKKIEENKLAIAKEQATISNAFMSPNGAEALKTLRRLFYDRPSYVEKDSHKTSFKEGQRDVVGYIIECIKTNHKTYTGVDDVQMDR